MVDVVNTFAVHSYTGLSEDTTADAWNLYAQAFEESKKIAMQRHLMTPDEFTAVTGDRRVTKYLATGTDGHLVGMSTLTNHLDAVPLIEPAWFAERFPAPFHNREIWYLGFACVADPRTLTGGLVFEKLIEHMAIPARMTRGMVFMDFATANRTRLIPGIRRTVARLDPEHTLQVYDAQEYWGFDFRQEAAR